MSNIYLNVNFIKNYMKATSIFDSDTKKTYDISNLKLAIYEKSAKEDAKITNRYECNANDSIIIQLDDTMNYHVIYIGFIMEAKNGFKNEPMEFGWYKPEEYIFSFNYTDLPKVDDNFTVTLSVLFDFNSESTVHAYGKIKYKILKSTFNDYVEWKKEVKARVAKENERLAKEKEEREIIANIPDKSFELVNRRWVYDDFYDLDGQELIDAMNVTDRYFKGTAKPTHSMFLTPIKEYIVDRYGFESFFYNELLAGIIHKSFISKIHNSYLSDVFGYILNLNTFTTYLSYHHMDYGYNTDASPFAFDLETNIKNNPSYLYDLIIEGFNKEIDKDKIESYVHQYNTFMNTNINVNKDTVEDIRQWIQILYAEICNPTLYMYTEDFLQTILVAIVKYPEYEEACDIFKGNIKQYDLLSFFIQSLELNNNNSIFNILDQINKCSFSGEQIMQLITLYSGIGALNEEKACYEKLLDIHYTLSDDQINQYEFLRKLPSYYQDKTISFEEIVNGKNYNDLTSESSNLYTYDYGLTASSTAEIKAYFTDLSMNGTTVENPFVISLWSNDVYKDDISWNVQEVYENIKQSMKDNFDEDYTIKKVNGQLINDDVVTKSILVREKTQNGQYPWIEYLVCGEVMIKNTLTIMIYVNYNSRFDSSLEGVNSFISNEMIGQRVSLLKGKMLPRLDKKISFVIDVLTKSIKKWADNDPKQD